MTDQPQLDALIARIQQQRAATDRETIRRQLLESGAAPQLVDRALAQVYGLEPVPASQISSHLAGHSASVERIRAYLEQHKQTYTREALRKRLIEDGHSPEAVDLAITRAYGYAISSTPAPQQLNRAKMALTIIGLFLFNYIVWGILIALTFETSLASLWAVPVMLVLEGLGAIWLRRHDPALSRGLAWGIGVTVLPIAMLALLLGICLAIIGTLY